jgi:large subunit ribosomal protein L29
MAEMAKSMKPADVRLKTSDELNALLLDLRKEQFNLRFQRATGQNEGVSRVRVVRRDIARVKTILAEKQRASATTPAAGAAGQS